MHFNGGAEIERRGIAVGYESDIYSLALSGGGGTIVVGKGYYPADQGPGAAAVGSCGDHAVANHTEHGACPDGRVSPTGRPALLYVVRPTGGRSTAGYGEVDAGCGSIRRRGRRVIYPRA